MTGLIVASLLFLTSAAGTLGAGWVNANGALIWCSIAASAATAITLAVAYSRSKVEAAAATRRTARSGRASTGARAPGARSSGGPAGGPQDADVVAIPTSRKYHRPDCRYAKVKGAVKMQRSAAKRRFDPCGICRP